MPQRSVIVQTPASTSNCGPGFDTLSIALSLYNFIEVRLREDGKIVGTPSLSAGAQSMVEAAARGFEDASGVAAGGFDYDIWGEVPIARGLGSSSTLRAGIIAGLNQLTGRPLDQESMIRLTTRLDNAPDNACAVFAGGFCIARTDADTRAYREHVRFDLPEDLIFAVVSPDYEVLTADSREVLPDSIPFYDAVQSANSLAYLVGLIVSGDFRRLSGAVEDYMHQPYRELLNPFGRESIAAGSDAGAYAGWLSGSGSTVACLCDAEHCAAVLQEMQSVYEQNAISSRAFRLVADNRGLSVQ